MKISRELGLDLAVIILALNFLQACCHSNGNPNMRSFSDAIKAGFLQKGEETLLFEKSFGEPGMITQQWFTGKGTFDEYARIRIYIDSEETASLDFNLYLAHGIGVDEATENENTPWAVNRMGHLATGGGLYNSFYIPFGSSVKVTVENPVHGGYFWYIIRGIIGSPSNSMALGNIKLPSTARLRLYKNINVILEPLDFITLANISSSAGAIYMVTMNVLSLKPYFMEGCFRAVIDDDEKTTFLSSGFEDFFLSAYYFDRGVFHDDNSGLTYKSNDEGHIVAYKFFENDPLYFKNSTKLIWRNWETAGGADGCPYKFSPALIDVNEPSKPVPGYDNGTLVFDNAFDATVSSYVWVYEW